MKRKLIWGVFGLFVAWGILATSARADTTCFSTYTSGALGNYLKFCVSADGVIADFESPSFTTPFGIGTFTEMGGEEGYVIGSACGTVSPVTNGAEGGPFESGFGAPTITQPNGSNTFPLTITRSTMDGVFQLTQSYSRNSTEDEVIITMTLKNVSASPVSNIFLARYFRDYLGTGSQIGGRTFDTVWDWAGYGLSLEALSFNVAHVTDVEDAGAWSLGTEGNGCYASSAVNVGVPTGKNQNGWVGRVVYELGTLKAGASKTVKIGYRRF